MEISSKGPKLIYEEKKAIKLFLWLFYFFFISYDFFWYIVLPKFTDYGAAKFPSNGLGYWLYILVFLLLPISISFIKRGNPYIVKYLLLFGYILIDSIGLVMKYYGTNLTFASGNIVELLFVFFSPVFVNKEYYWSVTIGLIGRYVLLGLILHDTNIIPPMFIIIILSAIAFIILIRFYSYIKSLTSVHEELSKKEKLAVIGQMAAAIGHEIRNPLSSLKGFTQLQLESKSSNSEFYPIMLQEIDRINSIVDDLMYLGKPREIDFKKVDMEEIVNYTISLICQQAESQGVKVETSIDTPIPLVDCDEKQLKQVFINLLKNAVEAMSNGGNLKIEIKMAEESSLDIVIEDNGCGIDAASLENLFEAFYTTKSDGTGLGLLITRQIIKDHGGSLKIESILGAGTKVIVHLPIAHNSI
ncbi:ATP-binding protein [Neobacillus citreus]|uniref:histidine kinase n=1 Tax=Neobacillus citreus TaxID=2833578 RepID=A0A942T7Z2_9BACI|nr:ATP-binding protein [Neobacillus citreus]MCH6265615.1 ATP-binding protein [Neobacillus citreus]